MLENSDRYNDMFKPITSEEVLSKVAGGTGVMSLCSVSTSGSGDNVDDEWHHDDETQLY